MKQTLNDELEEIISNFDLEDEQPAFMPDAILQIRNKILKKAMLNTLILGLSFNRTEKEQNEDFYTSIGPSIIANSLERGMPSFFKKFLAMTNPGEHRISTKHEYQSQLKELENQHLSGIEVLDEVYNSPLYQELHDLLNKLELLKAFFENYSSAISLIVASCSSNEQAEYRIKTYFRRFPIKNLPEELQNYSTD